MHNGDNAPAVVVVAGVGGLVGNAALNSPLPADRLALDAGLVPPTRQPTTPAAPAASHPIDDNRGTTSASPRGPPAPDDPSPPPPPPLLFQPATGAAPAAASSSGGGGGSWHSIGLAPPPAPTNPLPLPSDSRPSILAYRGALAPQRPLLAATGAQASPNHEGSWQKRGPKTGYRNQLMNRIAVVESLVVRSGAPSTSQNDWTPPSGGARGGHDAPGSTSVADDSVFRVESLLRPSNVGTPSNSELDSDEGFRSLLDKVFFDASLTIPTERESPAVSFGEDSRTDDTMDGSDADRGPTQAASSLPPPPPSDLVEESPALRQHLLAVYLSRVQPRLYCILDEPATFATAPATLPGFLADAMCAMGALFSTHPELGAVAGRAQDAARPGWAHFFVPDRFAWSAQSLAACRFAERARRAVPEFSDPGTEFEGLACVQALQLLACFYYGFGNGKDSL
ncbi:hypothetical protein HK405_014017, partial [Cladochytrium tenue]